MFKQEVSLLELNEYHRPACSLSNQGMSNLILSLQSNTDL